MSIIQQFPQRGTAFQDPNGNVNSVWYRTLLAMWTRTGGGTSNDDIAAKVSKSGDTMTGDLTLRGVPTSPNGAAPKSYTDAETNARVAADALLLSRSSAAATYTPLTTAAQGEYLGTATNDAATAGNVGEFVSSVVQAASAVAIATGVAKDVTTISLSAGDWDVSGAVWSGFAGGAITALQAGLGLTSATLTSDPSIGSRTSLIGTGFTTGNTQILPLSPARFSLAVTTTVYLVAAMTFSGTANAYGIIRARRVR